MIIDTKQTDLIKGLDSLISQLSGIRHYYEVLEEKTALEHIENFKKETHLACVMHPAYTPSIFNIGLLGETNAEGMPTPVKLQEIINEYISMEHTTAE